MNILITGSPGIGKTTIGLLLEKNGYGFIDIDQTQDLKYWSNKKTGERILYEGGKDLDWYEKHDLNWDREVLKKLLKEKKEEIVFVAGITSNFANDLDLFDKVILLKSNIHTLRDRRIERRGKNAKFNMAEIEQGFDEHEVFQKNMTEYGAVIVDADHDIDNIVEEILTKIRL